MNVYDWIDLQKDILYQSAMAQAKVVQQVLADKSVVTADRAVP